MRRYYKYELHVHDCLCSACAHSTPEEMVEAYRAAGYSGMCFTNHFLRGNTAVDRALPWDAKMRAYYNAYLRAKRAAEGTGFSVLFGIEHAYGHGKEVLTYGIDLDFLLENPEIDRLPLSEYARRVWEAGGFVSMAHPFRDRGYIDMSVGPEPEWLDAVEVYNFYNGPGENEKALEYARAHGLRMTSGADEHIASGAGVGKAGLAFEMRIETNEELVAALKSGAGKVIWNGEIQEDL